jgi:hypothetical protein
MGISWPIMLRKAEIHYFPRRMQESATGPPQRIKTFVNECGKSKGSVMRRFARIGTGYCGKLDKLKLNDTLFG